MKNLISRMERILPRRVFLSVYGVHAGFKTLHALWFRYAMLRSACTWKSVDRKGDPIPWFTYPAVEYLDNLDLTKKRLFEYGSGNSTVYWAKKAHEVVAVEDDSAWKADMEKRLAGTARLLFAPEKDDYVHSIETAEGPFDVIVIDGSHRLECAKAAVSLLNPGGVVILDDSDDYADVAEFLRQTDLMEVDFSGFNPINSYTKTTSFFFHALFRPTYARLPAPAHSIGHHARREI